jgi:lactate racemase
MSASEDGMTRVRLELRSFATDLVLPAGTEILRTNEPEPLPDVRIAVQKALSAPIGTPPLMESARKALARTSAASCTPSVVVVVSDNTRSVPYRGEGGILWPLVESLLFAGFEPECITLLVATGTHRSLSEKERWSLLDERLREAGVRTSCHDAADRSLLTLVGRTAAGDDVFMNREYVEADFRILTGLVEPHLIAGASGGRKSICPGLVDVRSVRGFHGARTLADMRATALVLDGNPCHEVSLEVARMARPDFILNVTARRDGRVAGVFAGDMEQAHAAAVEHLRTFAQIPLGREYDVVVTHGGLVGINHYQAEKGADIGARAAKEGGYVILVADTTESDTVGTGSYRRMIGLLADIGPEAFMRTIQRDDWEFVHDQWGAQMWARVMGKVPRDHLFYYSPQTPPDDYALLPGVDPRSLLTALHGDSPGETVARFVGAAVGRACGESRAALGREPVVAYLADGPHGIPV